VTSRYAGQVFFKLTTGGSINGGHLHQRKRDGDRRQAIGDRGKTKVPLHGFGASRTFTRVGSYALVREVNTYGLRRCEQKMVCHMFVHIQINISMNISIPREIILLSSFSGNAVIEDDVVLATMRKPGMSAFTL